VGRSRHELPVEVMALEVQLGVAVTVVGNVSFAAGYVNRLVFAKSVHGVDVELHDIWRKGRAHETYALTPVIDEGSTIDSNIAAVGVLAHQVELYAVTPVDGYARQDNWN